MTITEYKFQWYEYSGNIILLKYTFLNISLYEKCILDLIHCPNVWPVSGKLEIIKLPSGVNNEYLSCQLINSCEAVE